MSLISELTDFPEDPLPAELFHYTNQDGLLGIIKDKVFWTTKITCLNDSSEYFLAFKIAKSILENHAENREFDTGKVHYLLDEMSSFQNNIYVGSFSEKGDLLSQWRAYGSSTSGYALGFNCEKLVEIARSQGFHLSKCIYDRKIQEKIIGELIIKQLNTGYFPDPGTYGYNPETRVVEFPPTSIFWHELSRIAPLIKDIGFQEEQEWRLISERGSGYTDVKFRRGVSFIIPYFSLNLPHLKDLISSITIGPTPHPKISQETLSMLLFKENFSKLKLPFSEVPFRFW